VAGAFVLAVLVNVVELLCTAGLPALYTSILSRQGYGPAGRYGYLALYIAAYMFEDALMVGIMTATLSRRRLQQSLLTTICRLRTVSSIQHVHHTASG